jgi:phosphomannomutase
MKKKPNIDSETDKNIQKWLEGHYDESTKNEIRSLLVANPELAIDSFYTHLTFGTAGLRGVMGVGSNRMNNYTVRAATQGLANYIQSQTVSNTAHSSVLIGYDSRIHSREFAEETAKVLAGNGIKVFLYKEIRPTPLVSFGCRYKKCMAAIMITASHNPPEYNGYKVYWSDGGQLVPPHDEGVMREVSKITDPTLVRSINSIKTPLIEEVNGEIDTAYLKAITELQNYPSDNKKQGSELKIVYTSLHGTGITMAPKAFTDWGFTNVKFVDSQVIPDGHFPTVHYPNPEEPAALSLGIELMLKTGSDIMLATDPDADRIGVVALHQGKPVILTGNQIAALCLNHVCKAFHDQNRLPSRAAFIKTIGTTELFQAICDKYHSSCFNVLPGFKYIAEKIHQWESETERYKYVFGGEESCGYLFGTQCRDKDAILSSVLISEMALQAKIEKKSLVDKLYDLYKEFGVYQELLKSLNFGETKEGKEQMSQSMAKIRKDSLQNIAGIPIERIDDCLTSTRVHLKTGDKEKLLLPQSDVLIYWLEDGSKVMVRPSGTEPKVKLYCGIVQKEFSSIDEGIQSCQERGKNILEFLQKLLQEKKI